MRHGWVGSEHLLLGLVKEGPGLPSEILRSMGVDYESVHREVLSVLDGLTSPRRPKDSAGQCD
jgi:ATP-dependent Clp protease ATP-binding subunit ClpC